MMKKSGLIYTVVALMLCAACTQNAVQNEMLPYDTVTVVDNLVIDENSVPIFPKKAALTTDTARRFSIELPKRCSVDWNNQTVVSVVPEEKIEIVRLDMGDALPDLQVSDYEFRGQTVKQALDKLLDGTDIAVVADEEMIEKITGSIQTGALTDAVELMAKMGRAYYTYDAAGAELHIPIGATRITPPHPFELLRTSIP